MEGSDDNNAPRIVSGTARLDGHGGLEAAGWLVAPGKMLVLTAVDVRGPPRRIGARAVGDAALAILDDEATRPPRRGRRVALARLLQPIADYRADTLAKYFRKDVDDWEAKNPGK